MECVELEELIAHWNKKYPTVEMNIRCSDDQSKYYGTFTGPEDNFMEIDVGTIDELILQTEIFLRKVIK